MSKGKGIALKSDSILSSMSNSFPPVLNLVSRKKQPEIKGGLLTAELGSPFVMNVEPFKVMLEHGNVADSACAVA